VITPELPEEMANDPDFIFLVEQFVGRLPEMITDAETMLANDDWDGLMKLMHNLKGNAGGFGFPGLTDRAGNIHALLRENNTVDIPALLGQLVEYCRQIQVGA
jgi:HPt (histidine-containing phosphotransfer) domain-containing protein